MSKNTKILLSIVIITVIILVSIYYFGSSKNNLNSKEQELKNVSINEFKEVFLRNQRNFCNGQGQFKDVCNAGVDSFAAGMDWELLYDTYMAGDMSYFDQVNIANSCCGQYYL